MTFFLGLDPGISGGFGILDKDGSIIIAEPMPLMRSPVYGKDMVNALNLYDLIKANIGDGLVKAAIERVSAMPKQGVTSSFNFGVSYGLALGVIGCLQISHEFVLPRKWKGDMGLSSDKEASLGMAMRKWPKLKLKKKDDGIAESLLIAEWLRMKDK